jgi:iron complex outermembrane recepter protein
MKKLVQNIVFLLLIALSIPSYSQVVLKGEVVDGVSGEGLIGASVYIDATEEGTITDFDGSFELKVKGSLPVKITFSYTGYEDQVVEVSSSTEKLKIKLAEAAITTTTVEVVGQRVSEKQKASPLTVESLDLLAIKQAPTDNFYDGLGSLKGVDLTAAILGASTVPALSARSNLLTALTTKRRASIFPWAISWVLRNWM